MKQKITGFHTDEENHWVADLECGHAQHVRHDPPFFDRPWVITEEGRKGRLNTELNCVRCDEAGLAVAKAVLAESKKKLAAEYESAGLSGLCDEGRFEAAVGSLESMPLQDIIESVLKGSSK